MEFFSFVGFRKSDRREHRVPATKTPRFRVRAILQKKPRVKRERDDGRFAPENASESAPPRRLIRRRLATDAEPARGENASSENRPPHDRRQECLRPQGGVPAELRFPAPPVLCVKGISKAAGTQTDRRPLSVFSHQLSVACHFALTKSSDSTISIR